MHAVQLKTLLAPWLLPPFSLILLACCGLVVALRWRRTGMTMAAAGLAAAVALNLPIVANALAAWVEAPYLGLDPPGNRLPAARLERARARPAAAPQAIVVLAGGIRDDGADSRSPSRLRESSLERVLHGRRIARLTGLPVLISGGVPPGGGPAEAELMAAKMDREFGQPVRWVEARSRDTIENARYSRDILKAQGIDRIVLVTNALHMRRAEAIFAAEGFRVLPAAHDFLSAPARFDLFDFSPSPEAYTTSRAAIRELIGLAWLRIRPWFGEAGR